MQRKPTLSVKVPTASQTFNATGPSRGTSSKSQISTRSGSKKSTKTAKPSRSMSTRSGRVSPLSAPTSPVTSSRHSLHWALNERCKTPPPKIPEFQLRDSQLWGFQAAQGLPPSIAFQAAAAPPPIQQRVASQRHAPPAITAAPSANRDPGLGRPQRKPVPTHDSWEDISLNGPSSHAGKCHAPSRPSRAATAQPKQGQDVFQMQPLVEAGGRRARVDVTDNYNKIAARGCQRWWVILSLMVIIMVGFGVGVAVIAGKNK